MEIKATSSVGATVGKYLRNEVGNVNIEHAKTILEPYVKNEKMLEIRVAADLFDYFSCSGTHDFLIIEALKHLLGILNREDLVRYIEAYEFLLKTLTGTSNAENFYNIYKKISLEIENRIGCRDANSLKQEYEDVIDSVRTLNAIQNMRDLLSVLEDRDVISNTDVSLLESILDKFGETSLKKLVLSYKAVFNPSTRCAVCGYNNGSVSLKQVSSQVSEEEAEELQNALTYLYTNLGPGWKKLARSLKINEARIKSIQKENISDVEEQTVEMLNYWKHTCDHVSVACLVSALRSKICNFVYLANEIEKKTYRNFH